jgi:uncharacterized protein (TIGR00297 family)
VTWLLGAVLGSAVAALAYWRRSLTGNGALAAAGVGTIVFVRGGLPGAAALLAFFVSSSALSRGGAQAKGARRDAWQVLANGGAATLCLALGSRGGFVGSLAAAAADTWATEIGMRAPHAPRMITTGRVVEPGTSGGVTALGLLASAGGATVVGAAWAVTTQTPRALRLALITGLCGSILDSLLGATVQALYRCPQCGALTESSAHQPCDERTQLVHGFEPVTNDTVNALATLAAAGLGAALGL